MVNPSKQRSAAHTNLNPHGSGCRVLLLDPWALFRDPALFAPPSGPTCFQGSDDRTHLPKRSTTIIWVPKMSLLQRRRREVKALQVSRPSTTPVEDCECLKRYQILEMIGQGSSGKVYRAQRRSDQCKVALKVMDAVDEEALQLRRSEFEVLCTVSHPNIVTAHDFFSSNGRAVLVLSYHSGQTLRSLVKKSGSLPEAVGQRLFTKLMTAVDYLHSRRIVHRDITANNIIVSEDTIDLHLADFNAAKALFDGGSLTLTGSMDYLPPEVLKGESSSEKHDIWSAGLCLHLMMLGQLPYKSVSFPSSEAFREVVTNRPVTCTGSMYSGISDSCKSLLKQCLALEKEARPAAMILLEMEWLEELELHCGFMRRSTLPIKSDVSDDAIFGHVEPVTSPRSPTSPGRRASLPPRLRVAAGRGNDTASMIRQEVLPLCAA